MGKKNLIKSTAKTKKVKTASGGKKTVKKAAGAKVTTSKKIAAQKSKVKKKAVTKAAAKKITSSIPKKISIKDLIFKKFDRWQPEKLYVVDREAQFLQNYQAGSFVAENTEEAKRIKKLLFLQFDLEVIRKQAAEKVAMEKAAAEKAIIEKAAIEKAAAEKTAKEKVVFDDAAVEKEIRINVAEKSEHKYLTKKIISVTACSGVIFLLLIFSSLSNIKNYYIKSTATGIEILKGDFAPMGNSRLITLMDWQSSDLIKPVYTKEEIYFIIMARVEELLNSTGTSDPEKIKLYIIKALPLAPNKDARKVAYKYIDTIKLQIEKKILGTENK